MVDLVAAGSAKPFLRAQFPWPFCWCKGHFNSKAFPVVEDSQLSFMDQLCLFLLFTSKIIAASNTNRLIGAPMIAAPMTSSRKIRLCLIQVSHQVLPMQCQANARASAVVSTGIGIPMDPAQVKRYLA
tara:strand:- start:29864 stop:30247 length:384 start_codon:yes stop_codon:yes gene_type:complete